MAFQTASRTRFEVKETDDEARTFTGLASTWDMDLGGDIIHRGAFRDTLKEWQADGRALPLLDSHNAAGSVENVIGKMVEAKETQEGLMATFQLMQGDAKAEAVYRRIKEGYVDGLSIGYEALAWEKPDEDEKKAGAWRVLKKVNLMEVSVVLWPMNTGARIADVKSAVRSMEDDALSDDEVLELRKLVSRLGNIIAQAKSREDAGAGPTDPPAKDEPEETKDSGPTPEPEAADAPPEPAGGEQADEAPEYVKEALLERLSRLKITNRVGDEGDE